MSKRAVVDSPKSDKDCDVSIGPETVKKARFTIADILDDEADQECRGSPIPTSSEKVRARVKLGTKMKEGNLPIDCKLEGSDLWAKFYDLGTEMIITKSGRKDSLLGKRGSFMRFVIEFLMGVLGPTACLLRMFPTVKVSFSNVVLDALYYIFLDVVPVDSKRYRYIYNKSAWLTAGKAEPVPKNRLYLHPDSPFSGDQLLKHVISFEKTKLTNNEVDKTGHLILNSMHKYQPRIHIVQRFKNDQMDPTKVVLADEQHCTFTFPETQFMAVTAYQNQLITKLKIEKNPFAKGFRDPTGRSPDEIERGPSDMSPVMLSNFYHSSAFQQAMFQQCLSKSLQINPSIMLMYQNAFSSGQMPSPLNPEISLKSD